MKQQIIYDRQLLDDIMALPCITGAHKTLGGWLVYHFVDPADLVDGRRTVQIEDVYQGDTITQDDDGRWHVTRKGQTEPLPHLKIK